jgi:hypothetical protein
MRVAASVGAILVACTASRPAAPASEAPPIANDVAPTEGTRSYVVMPASAFTPRASASSISPYLYLDRCTGGCTVQRGSISDARTHTSTIVPPGTHTISEFANSFGQTGTSGIGTCIQADGSSGSTTCSADASCINAFGPGSYCDTADYEWNLLVKCMTEVYSPYAVTLLDTLPSNGVSYDEALIAGQPSDVGWIGALGVAPVAGDCSAQDDTISFTFANAHPGVGMQRVLNLCWTAAQETAHVYGLDHEYQFLDAFQANSNSACMDPMTYRTDCGGQKFFRNAGAFCGEYAARDCLCGGTQNTHQTLLSVFGAGAPITAPPTIAITIPRSGETVGTAGNAVVHSYGGAQRGISKLELWLNGYPWTSQPGLTFGPNGQPTGYQAALVFPNGVPHSIVDIVVKAYDDLGTEADAAITVTNVAPCNDASTCANGQQCGSGRCFWPPAVGTLGAPCTYDQYCLSNRCTATTHGSYCSQACVPGVLDACPTGFDCSPTGTGPADGVCIPPPKPGGGCRAARGDNGLLIGFGAVGLVLATRRRRRRGRSPNGVPQHQGGRRIDDHQRIVDDHEASRPREPG